MDTPSALTDELASDVEYEYVDQELHSLFPELDPTDYLGSHAAVDDFSSPDSGYIDPSFVTGANFFEGFAYDIGTPRALHSVTHNESISPAQVVSMTTSSASPDSQVEMEQQKSDDSTVEGQFHTGPSVGENPTSSENALRNEHDSSSLQRGGMQHDRYLPTAHSNPETPRLLPNSSFDINSPMLSRTYSQHSTQQLATGPELLTRPSRRTISYPSEYTEAVGNTTLNHGLEQSYAQPPMPNSVARLQGGGSQSSYRTTRPIIDSSAPSMTTNPSSAARFNPMPDYSHLYGLNTTTSRYLDPQRVAHIPNHMPSYPSPEIAPRANRLGYDAQIKGEYRSSDRRSNEQQAYNSSRRQPYQANSMSTTDDRASSSPYLGHTASIYNPQQSVLHQVNSAEQGTLKFEDSGSPNREKLTIYTNLTEAIRGQSIDYGTGYVPYDPTIPTCDIAKQRIVVQLAGALNDMSEAQDNEGMKISWRNFLNDQGKLEYVAWQILERCIERQRQKGSLVPSSKSNHHYENFEARMSDIVQGLRTQKTMCKHLMGAPYIDSMVDNPGHAASRIVNNRKVNWGKKVTTDKARAILGQKTQGKGRRMATIPEDDYNDEDGEYDEDDNIALTAFDDFDADVKRLTPIGPGVKTTQTPAKTSKKRKATSKDVLDPQLPPPAKNAKKPLGTSRSQWQLNERNEIVEVSQLPPQQAHGLDTSATGQQAPVQRNSGGFMGHQRDEGVYGTSSSGGADPTQGQLSPRGRTILNELLEAQQTNAVVNPGNLLDDGTFIQGGKIMRQNSTVGTLEVLYEDFLMSPQYSQFTPFLRGDFHSPYAPIMDPQVNGVALETGPTTRARRTGGRATQRNTQVAREPPYGYTPVAPAEDSISTLQKAPFGRKKPRR